MIISITSGKGGTGKTFLGTNMAWVIRERAAKFLDCDVEEPNGSIFLKPVIEKQFNVDLLIPDVDLSKCTHCGKCSEVCFFNAITDTGSTVLVFPELCHGCGGCQIACRFGAIKEKGHPVGVISTGESHGIDFAEGKLNIREVASAFLIRKTKEQIDRNRINIIDTSPGTTCPTVNGVMDSDYCILVTEPTPFGLNDLRLAIEMLKSMNIPHGVVINRDGIGNREVEHFCDAKEVRILGKIPHDIEIAKLYSNGILAATQLRWLANKIQGMFDRARKEMKN